VLSSGKILDLLVKVDRAEKHLFELHSEMARFNRPPKPYQIDPKDDLEKRERTFYLRLLKPIPQEFSAIIGDIAQNLRSALDHLAWHLVTTSPVSPKARDRDIYFPIFKTESEYRNGKMTKILGMTDAAILAIDDIKPYFRLEDGFMIGNPPLYELHAINAQDKHRLLIPAWTGAPGHSIKKSSRAAWAPALRAAFGSENADVMMPSLVDSNMPLEDGSRLCPSYR
jgi:hypothetical protein